MIMLRGSIVCLALSGLLLAAGSQPASAAKTCTTVSAWAVSLSEADASKSASNMLKWRINSWAWRQKAKTVYTGKTSTACQKGLLLPRCTATAKVCA